MNWGKTPISELTDDELRDAILSVGNIDKNRLDRLEAAKKRHKKLFEAYPPVENENFIILAKELNQEFKNRKLESIQNA